MLAQIGEVETVATKAIVVKEVTTVEKKVAIKEIVEKATRATAKIATRAEKESQRSKFLL